VVRLFTAPFRLQNPTPSEVNALCHTFILHTTCVVVFALLFFLLPLQLEQASCPHKFLLKPSLHSGAIEDRETGPDEHCG
jgi:hypothetical protein